MFSNFLSSFEYIFAKIALGLLSSVNSDPRNFIGFSIADRICRTSPADVFKLNGTIVACPEFIDSERHLLHLLLQVSFLIK